MTGDLACNQVVELVTDYLEGAMAPAEARALEAHLATCPGCTEYLGQMRSIAGSLRPATDDALPAGLRDDLLDAFRRTRP
jgi:anti-sigma factor (TIGR02949 family)